MGCCRICSWLTGKGRGEIQDRELRRIHTAGPRDSFLQVRPLLHGRVLEIGCGTGILFDDYLAGAAVSAVEIDADFLGLAHRNAERSAAKIRVIGGDGQNLPFIDHLFDAAVLQLVLCSIPDPLRALHEVVRVLRPGGLIYFYEHIASWNPLYRFVQNVTDPLMNWFTEGCHWNRDTPAMLQALPITIESDDRRWLRKGLMPPLPIMRTLARKT